MKILAFCLLSMWPAGVIAQESPGITVLNPAMIETVGDENVYHFYQGQTIIVALDEELKGQRWRWWIHGLILGDTYTFNQKGIALVGIKMTMMPGEYPICLDDRCKDSDRKNQLRIKILKTDFSKTRISAYTGEPNPRRDKQKNIIEDAFGKNRSEDDMTDGSFYVDPLAIPRDPSDSFGLIYENNEYRTHSGVDLKAKVGTPVRAVNRGKVILVAKMFKREGNMIIVSHGLDVFSVYMHLSKFGQIEVAEKNKRGKTVKKKRQLKAGDIVERGQNLGFSGTTGAGAKRIKHLHHSLRIKSVYVDPLYFIDSTQKYLK